MKLTGAQILWEALVREGVTDVFGYPGGAILPAYDAFQETDITGITLPITKHNYLVTSAADVAPAVLEAFAVARSGRPGPVLVDITKDAQQGGCEVEWDAAAAHLTEALDEALPGD